MATAKACPDHGEGQAQNDLDKRHARVVLSRAQSSRSASKVSTGRQRRSSLSPARPRPAKRARTGDQGGASTTSQAERLQRARLSSRMGCWYGAGRGRSPEFATTRPGRGRGRRSGRPGRAASSTSCVTSSTVRGSSASASASHSLQSRARDRVEGAEGLVEAGAPAGPAAACAGRRRAGASRPTARPGARARTR